MDRRKSETLISGTGFEHGKPLHAIRALGASHIGPFTDVDLIRPLGPTQRTTLRPQLRA